MSDRTKTILTALGVIGFAWLMFDFYHRADLLRARAKYTIGYVQGSHWAMKNGKQINYYATISGATYKGGKDELPGMRLAGGRYLVKYDSLDPEVKTVYFEYSIPDSIVEAPANGWRTPPFPVPADLTSRTTD